MTKGIDLCCQQHDVDWKQVKASGQVDFIIPRTGWGIDCDSYDIDPKFLEYVKGAKDNGISVPGVYHFIYVFSMDDAVKNAQCAVKAVEAAGLPKSTVIWCDQEEDTVIQAVKRGFNLTTNLQRQVTEIFCDYVLSKGYCTGVYLNHDYLYRVYGEDIMQKYDIWYADPYEQFEDPCLIKQNDWYGRIAGIPVNVDKDIWVGTYTAGTAKPRKDMTSMLLVDKFMLALADMGDGRYHYYDGSSGGIGCSEYVRRALVKAGVISNVDYFHAGSGVSGVLEDKTKFQRIAWNPSVLKKGDLLWSNGHHVAVWDGVKGVYEAAPESTHGICDNGKTGVGHWPNHGYRNCGTGGYTWSCIYRIIDPEEVKHDAKEEFKMDKAFNMKTLAGYLPVVRNGVEDNIVKGLQLIMQKYGWYAGLIDGSCGPVTVAGIKNLQTALGVEVDGSFGPKSWTALLS